jgi:hypothetical protein
MRKNPYIRFKTPALENQWRDESLPHPALVVAVNLAALIYYRMTGQSATITSLYRDNDPGVHGQKPCRGADLRTHGLMGDQKAQWTGAINTAIPYQSSKPTQTAMVHDVGRGDHLHLQIGPLEPMPKRTQEA